VAQNRRPGVRGGTPARRIGAPNLEGNLVNTSDQTLADAGQTRMELERLVADLQAAQQRESVDDFIALFRHDAVWTTAMGKRLQGREEIASFTARVLPGAMRESTATYDVVHTVLARPDVAVINVRQRPVTHEGELLEDEPQGHPTYVVAREEGRWLIVSGQNTRIADPETLADG
jgi:uncharacterized protein (TIGR02246 family)